MNNKLVYLLKSLMKRINFFLPKINEIKINTDLIEYYEWFLMRNLIDFYKLSEMLKIKNTINDKNPFYIWATFFDVYKHEDKRQRIEDNFKQVVENVKNEQQFMELLVFQFLILVIVKIMIVKK